MNNTFLKILKIIVCVASAIFVFAVAVMFLWNWLIPDIFNGPTINFIQALGILVLSKILFTGFGGRGGCNHQGNRVMWRQKFYEKMQRMTPEEKEKFKSKFGKCFGDYSSGEKPTQPMD